MEGEIANVKRLLANCQAKFEAMKEEYAKYTRILHETEESLNRVNVEKTQCTAQLNEIRKAIEQQYREKVRLEDEILDKLRDQLTADKAAKYTQKIVHQLRERTKDLEQQIANAENDIAKTMLESTKVHTEIDLLEKRKTELEAEMKAKDDIVAKSQTEITRRNIEIKRKQDQLQQLNAEFDKLVLAAGGAELGPLEIQINSLHKSIEAENIAISELQQSWLRDQSELVRLSLEHDKQSSDVELMVKQHTILSQKKLRIEGEISLQLAEATGIEKEIHHLHIDMAKLDTLLHRERGAEDNLQQDNLLLESQFMTALKAAERESIQLQDRLESIKEEKERLLNSLVEAERQIMLWEKKTQLAKETRAAVDSDIGQGEIAAMRGEIHRMEVRYSQLMKQQEKMIQEMEKSVSRRETIAIRGEAQSKNSNKKIVTKNVLHRELAELKRKLKQTQQEANECETEIQRLKHQQQELSLQLDDRQVKVQQLQTASDCYDADIDRLSEQKQVNIADLLARQQKTKYYQKLKDGKYTRLCRSSASLDQEKCRQHDQMNEILAIVDRLCNEYPHAQPALRKVIVNYGSRVSGLSTDHL
jgi:chromosome segregation ATPase